MLTSAARLADSGNAFARLKADIQAERAALQTRFRATRTARGCCASTAG